MANEAQAIALLFLLALGGIIITFNLPETVLGLSGLGLKISLTGNKLALFYTLILRFVIGPVMAFFATWSIINIVRG